MVLIENGKKPISDLSKAKIVGKTISTTKFFFVHTSLSKDCFIQCGKHVEKRASINRRNNVKYSMSEMHETWLIENKFYFKIFFRYSMALIYIHIQQTMANRACSCDEQHECQWKTISHTFHPFRLISDVIVEIHW